MSSLENIFFEDRPVKVRACDHPGCSQAGDYRAPKTRELNDYYWFCLNHVRDYNKSWDFFAGMGPEAIEASIRRATVWDRPSWPLGEWHIREQKLREDVAREFFDGEKTSEEPATTPESLAERQALAVLNLKPPVTFATIKTHYRQLVKTFHPDANGGSRDAEEKFKAINHAFTILKQIYSVEEAD